MKKNQRKKLEKNWRKKLQKKLERKNWRKQIKEDLTQCKNSVPGTAAGRSEETIIKV